MFYSILKAITNFQCGSNFTSADYIENRIENYIFFTVYSFGSLYGIVKRN